MSQAWITNKNIYISGSNLTIPHLRSNNYENIHGLASMLDCVDDLCLSDKCKKQIKNYKNKPQFKLWKGYEYELLCYIGIHLDIWLNKHKFKSEINLFNWTYMNNLFNHPMGYLTISKAQESLNKVDWITDEVIETHRSILIQKEIEYQFKLYEQKCNVLDNETISQYYDRCDKIQDKMDNNYHYRNLWPDCPTDKIMRYDWGLVK